MQIDDGVLLIPLPDDNPSERSYGDGSQDDDEIRFEPILPLPLVENHLQGAEAKGNQPQPNVINVGLAEFAATEVWRILNQPRSQYQRKNAHRDVDEKNPPPTEVVRDPSAQGGPDGGRHDD